ncbi:hypothetical protein KDAU_50690 [Dictyobacter aurantiacus]|uniref:Uncharacterized protein n=1 Tax=Dictyobacter aurantiacus TaxID=1936993 RepID=A0A401ZLN7_9CHLR|nr:hypothetical protein KDAU_50690 [Dictyobacter aurantiacus]
MDSIVMDIHLPYQSFDTDHVWGKNAIGAQPFQSGFNERQRAITLHRVRQEVPVPWDLPRLRRS